GQPWPDEPELDVDLFIGARRLDRTDKRPDHSRDVRWEHRAEIRHLGARCRRAHRLEAPPQAHLQQFRVALHRRIKADGEGYRLGAGGVYSCAAYPIGNSNKTTEYTGHGIL